MGFLVVKAQKSMPGAEQNQENTGFFNYYGIVYNKYMPQGHTITKEYNHDVLCHDSVQGKKLDLFVTQNY